MHEPEAHEYDPSGQTSHTAGAMHCESLVHVPGSPPHAGYVVSHLPPMQAAVAHE